MSYESRKWNGKTGSSSQRNAHGHHHRRKKSLWRRFKHAIKKTIISHKWLIPSVLVSVVIVCIAAYILSNNIKTMAAQRVTASNQHNIGVGYRNISYKGKEYRYNTRISAILYMGIDSEGVMKTNETFIDAPRADSFQLLVIDGYRKKLSIIAIDRNTICKIHRYSRHGYDLGEFDDQLCLAYAYGDNGEVSSENVCNAVSKLLYGVPINDYIVCNRSSLPEFCDVMGKITVTVPNDDLVPYGYQKGDQMDITSDNIELFVRKRDTKKHLSNFHRMERQKVFINSTIDKVMDMIKSDPQGSWKKIEAAEYCMRTSITRNRYIDLSNLLSSVSYEDGNYYNLEGEISYNGFWAEFHPDEEKLLEKVVEVFYIPQ